MHITRKTLAGSVALIAGLSTATTAAALATTDHPQRHHSSSSDSHELSGTWATSIQIIDAPPGAPSAFNALDTFEPGGGLVVSSSAPNPATRGLAHGFWTHKAHRSYTATFEWFRFDPAGSYLGMQRVTRTMKVSHDGRSFAGTDVIEILAPTGAVVATSHANESGTLLGG